MKIEVKTDPYDYAVVMNEDGEFHCPHNDYDVEYDAGGDGYTEPGPSYSFYCNDCHNDDVEQWEVDNLIEAYLEGGHDPDFEYEQWKDSQL